MKIQFDTIHGIYSVNEFGREVDMLPEDLVQNFIPTCEDGIIYGAEISSELYAKLHEEYTIR
jgi:hypothetical protein